LILFVGVIFVTIIERKFLGRAQLRLSPNKVRVFGGVQPMLDGVKLFLKNSLNVISVKKVFFIFSFFF